MTNRSLITIGRILAGGLVLVAAGFLTNIPLGGFISGAASAAYYGYCPGGGASAVYYGYCPPSNATPVYTPPADQTANEGASTSFALGSFSDPDGGPWEIVVSWGDPSPAETFSRSTAGTIPPRAHTYDDNATYTVSVTVTDSDGASDSGTFQVVVANVAPTATFEAQSPVDEGSSFHLALTSPSDPSGADTVAGFVYAFDCGDGAGYGPFGPSNTRDCPTTDNGTRAVGGKIRDKDLGTTEYTATVVVNNVPPSCGPIVVVPPVTSVSTLVTATAPFTDPGTADTHTAVMDWGDGTSSPATVAETAGSGTATATHTYSSAGIYTLILTVTDDDGGSGQCTFEFVIVFDRAAGFVTGGGWIDSPPGAYTADPTLTGKANFGFVAKYHKDADVPSGNTEFQFKAGDVNFKSTGYEWLVVFGARAVFMGSGTINGAGDYRFFVSVIDGQKPGGGGDDKFRIRIWEAATGIPVYDNGLGASITTPPATSLGGGSITIHS